MSESESGANLKGVLPFIDEKPKKVGSQKRRKNFDRSQHHFKPRDQRKVFDGARHVRRRKNFEDLISQLEALRFDGEGKYIDSEDDDATEITPFDYLFLEEESMAIWENFINSSEEEQFKLLRKQSYSAVREHNRAPQHAYNRINCRLRHLLKRKRIPREQLDVMELALIDYFIEKPLSTYTTSIPNSYERLLFHAVSQYLDLEARSFDSRGDRRTKVLSKHNPFLPPFTTLASHMQAIQA